MPLYHYRCAHCGWEMEALMPMSGRDAPFICERCPGVRPLGRVITAPVIRGETVAKS